MDPRNPEAALLIGELEQAEEKLENAQLQVSGTKDRLERLQARCQHHWSEVKPDHIHTPGYKVAGDPPGTMGIDRRHDLYVEPHTEHRWKRECLECGKVDHTTRTEPGPARPVFSDRRW